MSEYCKNCYKLAEENKELKEQNKKYSAINEQDTKDYAKLTEKYNKMVEISKENLIKYEDLRLDNQKLIMEIENLKSQFEIETLKNNDTNECIYRSNLLNKYKYALEEIKRTIKHFKTYFSEKELNKVKFSNITVIEEIITEAIGE